MALIPIDDTEVQGTVEVPIEEDTTPAEIHERGKTAVLIAKDTGENPAEAYVRATAGDSRADNDYQFTSEIEDRRKDQIAMSLPYQEGAKTLNDLSELGSNLSGDFNSGNYKEAVKSMPMAAVQPEEKIAGEAVHMQMREELAEFGEAVEEMSLGDTVSSALGLMIPKRIGYSLAQLESDMGFKPGIGGAVDTFVDPTGTLLRLRNTYWSLDDAGKAEFINVMGAHLPNASDNKFVQGHILTSIIGGDFNENQEYFFDTLDNIDVTLISGGVVKLIRGLAKANKIINTPRRLKEADVEAEMIENAVNVPDAAAGVGITPADVGDHLNPLMHGQLGHYLQGASEDQAAAVTKMMEIQNSRFRTITDEMAKSSILDEDEIAAALRNAEIKALEEPGIVDAKVTLRPDKSGYDVEYTEAFFAKDGSLRKRGKTTTQDFRVSDIGDVRANEAEYHDFFLRMDPNARLTGKTRQWFVSDVEEMSRKQEFTAKQFDSMMRDAFKGIGQRGAARVDKVLRQGAKDGVQYTYDDLIHGIGTKGTKLKPNEARAYLGYRNVVDHLYTLKNKQMTEQWTAQGVKVWDGPEGVMPVKNYNDSRAAATAWKQVRADSHHILIPERGLTLGGWTWEGGLMNLTRKSELTKEMIDEAYSKGYVLARSHNSANFFKLGDNRTQWAFVKAKNVHSPRGKMVLNRLPGYVPKQRSGAYFFIKRNSKSGLSGASGNHRIMKTEAYSDTREAAEAWVAKQDNQDDYKIFFDRELPAEERSFDIVNTHGGMYSGHRKNTELAYVGRSDPNFLDSYQAIQHYINHIGRQYPASLYRLGSEHRLMEIAKGFGVKGKDIGLHNVLERAEEAGILKTTKKYKMLKDIHDQVSFVHMIPTDDEMAMADRIRKIGAFFDRDILKKVKGWEIVPKFFYRKAAENVQPQGIIRSLTFTHLLGMYNPAQIMVQFSGSLIAMAIDPIGYPKHVSKMIGWATLDNIATDPIAQKKVIQWMKSNDLGDYADEYELWSRSGYRESVEQGNADYTSVFTRNMPYDMPMWRTVAANNAIFYKMGELANTRVAFASAVSRYKKIHKVKSIDPKDEAALNEIGNWAEKFRLNMSRANQSWLNKGAQGVPFQFQQVISKYFEKVLPQWAGGTDEFTAAEKWRLAAIPTAMTGAVGVPFGQFVAVKIMDMFGIDETELSEEEALGIKYGAVGWFFNSLLDMNVNFSDRMTLGGDVLKNMWESLTTGKATWQWLGASSTVADRYARNMQFLAESFDLMSPEDLGDTTVEDILAYGSIIKEVLSDIPTVTRNWKQYSTHLFADHPRYMKDGRYMWEWETMNTQTAVAAMMGFQPTEMTEMYEWSKELKGNQSSIAQFGDTDAQAITRLINLKLLGSTKVHESKFYSRLINNMLHKYGPIEQRELLDKIWELMYSKQLDPNNLMWQTLLEEQKRMQTGLDIMNTQINRKIQERQ